jgi:hypothetical protein
MGPHRIGDNIRGTICIAARLCGASITVSSFDARAGTQRRSRGSQVRGDRRTAPMLIENLIPLALVSALIFGVLWIVREARLLRDDR